MKKPPARARRGLEEVVAPSPEAEADRKEEAKSKNDKQEEAQAAADEDDEKKPPARRSAVFG